MSCHGPDPRLDLLLDGELDDRDAASLHAHLSDCPSCRTELESRRDLLEAARNLPRSLAPPHDLWPGIEARLGRTTRVPRSTWSSWLGAAAAAVMLAAVTAGMLYGPRSEGVRAGDPTTSHPAPGVLGSGQGELAQARAGLLEALEQRRSSLSAGTVRSVLEGVNVIDRAIAAISTAMAEHPADAGLARRLVAAYRQEIDLLQRVNRLPDET